MLKKYESPELEVIELENRDVIVSWLIFIVSRTLVP